VPSHSARLQTERETAKATNIAREAALAFVEADANGDGILDWDEVGRKNLSVSTLLTGHVACFCLTCAGVPILRSFVWPSKR
jgi:hypothetical protein